jgi:hypothetical protein
MGFEKGDRVRHVDHGINGSFGVLVSRYVGHRDRYWQVRMIDTGLWFYWTEDLLINETPIERLARALESPDV